MKAEITIGELYNNVGLQDFHFRTQAWDTFEELLDKADQPVERTLRDIEDYTTRMDIDDVEEMFYGDSVEEIADEIGITLK